MNDEAYNFLFKILIRDNESKIFGRLHHIVMNIHFIAQDDVYLLNYLVYTDHRWSWGNTEMANINKWCMANYRICLNYNHIF